MKRKAMFDTERLRPGQMVVLDDDNILAVITERIDNGDGDNDPSYLVVPVAGSTREVLHYMLAGVVVLVDGDGDVVDPTSQPPGGLTEADARSALQIPQRDEDLDL